MSRAAQIVFGTAAGALVGVLVSLAGDTTPKRAIFAVGAVLLTLVLVLSKSSEKLSIAALIFSIPISINYFLFGLYSFHIGGAIGLCVVPLDVPLAFLYGRWFLERSGFGGRMPAPAKMFLPLLAVMCVSVVYSVEPSWAMYELVRWLRFLAIIVYFGCRIPGDKIGFCLGTLALAASFQGTLAIAQTVFRSNFGMDRLGIVGKGSENVFVEEIGAAGTMVRGAGTTGHPNALAPFLVVVALVFVLFALVDRSRYRRMLWIGASLACTGGIVVALSRAAWVAFAISAATAMMLAVYARLVPVRRVLTLSFCVLLVAGAACIPLFPKLAARWSAGFTEAIAMRRDLNNSALRMVQDHPVGGVGLNNFTVVYPEYDKVRADNFTENWGGIPAVHNLYLLVWSELGTAGLAAFAFFWVALCVWGFRLLDHLNRMGGAVAVGVMAGSLGLLISDLTSFAFWSEAVMYTSAVLFGLLEAIARNVQVPAEVLEAPVEIRVIPRIAAAAAPGGPPR